MSHPLTARLFIALDLPEALRAELSGWARAAAGQAAGARAGYHEAAGASGVRGRDSRRSGDRGAGEPQRMRLLDRDALHLTICFLGSRPIAEIGQLCAIVERCAAPLGECSLGAPLWLPPRRPRALAVEIHDDSETLARLHRQLLDALRQAGIAPADAGHGTHAAHAGPRGGPRHRPLRPHVTVARLRLAPRERVLPPTPQRSFTPQRLTLYRSWLSPEGASYEALAGCATLPLAASG